MRYFRYLGVGFAFLFTVSAMSAEQIDLSQYRHIPPMLVLISSNIGHGMGVVYEQNRVLTTAHVVYEKGVESSITIIFYPNFRKAPGKLLKATSQKAERELAIIEVDTADIKPVEFATAVEVGDRVSWYKAGVYDHPNLTLERGTVTHKTAKVLWPPLVYVLCEPDAPVGQEVAVVASGFAPGGSSGGPVLNKRQELAGIIFGADAHFGTSIFTSIDAVRRFLNEYNSEQAH